MSGTFSARLLAPIALVVTALALLLIIAGGGGDGSGDAEQPAATPAATAAATRGGGGKNKKPAKEDTKTSDRAAGEPYIVQSGDTPGTIAAAEGITTEELLEANPDADPSALAVGDELEIPGK